MSTFRSLSLFLGLVASAATHGARQEAMRPVAVRVEGRVEVRVDPRIELVTAVARLAGFREFKQKSSSSPYAEAVDAHFAPYAEHAAVQRLRRLRAERGVSFDALPSFAVHLGPLPELEELVPFDAPPERLDARWGLDGGRAFLAELRDLAAVSRAADFFAGHAELYAETEKRLSERLSKSLALPWFDRFFGERTGASYVAIPGLLCGGGNFGVGIRHSDGTPERITPVFGCWEWDEGGRPVFDDSYLPLFVHELAHSYTNPFVDRHAARLRASAARIHATCAEVMKRQAYGDWKTLVYESLVRAAVVRCRESTEGAAAGEEQAKEEVENGFRWVPDLARLYGELESDRATYPSFDSLMPKVADVFDRWAEKAEAEKAPSPNAPKLVSSEPAAGASDVDPALASLVLRFDRPMRDQGWSIVGSPDDVPQLIGKPAYDAERKVLTVAMRLEPGRTYRFGLNSPRNQGFRAADGTPLEPLSIEFSTRKK
jgi:hypothetical protein